MVVVRDVAHRDAIPGRVPGRYYDDRGNEVAVRADVFNRLPADRSQHVVSITAYQVSAAQHVGYLSMGKQKPGIPHVRAGLRIGVRSGFSPRSMVTRKHP